MNEDLLDIAVVGAGIGGACAAIAAARRGLRVALLEAGAMPRHKVCGEFLSPEILGVLNRLGWLEAVREAGAVSIQAARIVGGRRDSRALPFGREGLALSRFKLDAVLWNAALESGVECRHHTRVRDIERNEELTFRFQANGENRSARFVIAAPGRNARLLPHPEVATGSKPQRYAGFKTHFNGADVPVGEVELHPFRGGYCGLVGIEDGLANICLLASYESVAGRVPEVFWEWLLAERPALAARMRGAKQMMGWLSTGNVSFGSFHASQDGVLYCGDGAGYIHPLTGDGMAMAAQSAELAVSCIAANLQGGLARAEVAPLYEAAWERAFRKRLNWGAWLHPLLTSPVLTGPAMVGLSWMPGLARMAVQGSRG